MKVILVCLALVGLAVAELPSYIKPCNRNDPEINKCFVDSANDALKTLTKGDKKLQIPSLTPFLEHPGTKYEPNDEFFFQIKETTINGLDTIKLLEAKVNFKENTIWIKFKYDGIVDWKGTYIAKALKENDEVEDKSHIIFSDIHAIINIKFEEKDNHLSVVSLTTDYHDKPKIEYHLDNLDKHPAVKALWEKHHEGFEKVCSDARTKLYTVVFEKVLKAATANEIFPTKD